MSTVRNALFMRAIFAVLLAASGLSEAQPLEPPILPPQEAETVSGWEGVPAPIALHSAPHILTAQCNPGTIWNHAVRPVGPRDRAEPEALGPKSQGG